MNELSLFTGAGGGVLGTKLLGFNHIGYVEINDYCQRIIKQRIEDGILDRAPIFGDIKTFLSEGYAESYQGLVDVITAGFPCQPFSVAGKGVGESDERNMWPITIDVVCAIRPKYIFFENVPGLLADGYIRTIFRDLAESGYLSKWCVLGAGDCGSNHTRKRLWIYGEDSNANGQRLEESADQNRICNKAEQGRNSRRFSEMGNKILQQEIWLGKHPTPASDVRMDDGVANRAYRLKAIGNGQVPIVAKTAWELLTGYGAR